MAKDVRKVLMTTDAVGGVWTYSMELARALGGEGVEVVLATMGPAPDERQRREAAGVGNVTLRESLYRLEWMDEPWGDVERAGEWLLGLEEEFRPDVVHLNGYVHGGLGWRAPVMVVGHSCVLSWWRAVKGEEAPERYGRYREEVARGLRGADVVVAPSRAMAEAVEGHYGLVGGVRVIANGRERGLFRPLPKEPFVLAAGRIWDEAKNVAALDAVAPRVGWPVFVAGDEGLEGKTGTGGPRRLGRLSTGEMADWLGRASIYALPARYEPFGLSVLESAMAGCALVLGDIPSLRENWSGAAAFVPPDDHEGLAAAINRLAEDEGRRRALAELARERARGFSPGRMAAEYLGAYREMVGAAGDDESQRQVTGRDMEAGPVLTATRMASTSLERR